ncbi:MAG: hypothetical protein KGH57_01085 [Candidatus Micrarchaeota archaeon]|nr:hypothetical protein [Candidatus Micrarchaeota archaeon]
MNTTKKTDSSKTLERLKTNVLSGLANVDEISVSGVGEKIGVQNALRIHVAPKTPMVTKQEYEKLCVTVEKKMETGNLPRGSYQEAHILGDVDIAPAVIFYEIPQDENNTRVLVTIWPTKILANAVVTKKSATDFLITLKESLEMAPELLDPEFFGITRRPIVQSEVERDAKVLKEKMIELLSDAELQSYCAKHGPLQLLPITQGNEGEMYYLFVGFADNEYSRKKYGSDVGKQLSFYQRVDFNSLSLNSILERAGGIEAHVNDIEGTVKKIEYELDKNIYGHLPLKALQEGKFDYKYIEGLADPYALVDPEEAEHPERHGYWLKGKGALTPELLEKTIRHELGKQLLRIRSS